MSDYARANTGGATHFTVKDGLSTGDANKLIVGSEHDAEFEAIKTALNSKFDPDDTGTGGIATQGQAEAGTNNNSVMTPLRAEQHQTAWAAENGGLVGDIQLLPDPNVDTILGWDDSAGAAINYTLGAGLVSTLTVLSVNHDTATGFVANEHIDHTSVDFVAGTGMTGGGTIAASRTFDVIGGAGITANADDIAITDVVAGAAQPVVITAGTFTFDLSSITEITGPNLDQAADGFLINDAGTLKVMPIDQSGVTVVLLDADQTFAITDANTMQVLTGTTDRVWTIPANSAVAFEIGSFIIVQNSGTGDLTITADTGVILDSIFHTAAATAQSDRVLDGGRAVLIKTATDTWSFGGDIATS